MENIIIDNDCPINSVEDFITHTNFHRQRVVDIGLKILKNFKSNFELVDEKLLKSYLSLHDEAKIIFIRDRYIFGSKLFNNVFGKDIKKLTGEEKNKAIELVKIVNHYDSQISREFFKAHHMVEDGQLNEVALQMKRIEQLADMIERGINPLSEFEFGRPMKRASALLKNEFEIEIAKSFEV